MLRQRDPFFAALTACIYLLLAFQNCRAQVGSFCAPACGDVSIGHPFRLETDPSNCGDKRYTLSCLNNATVLHLYSGKYYVQAINYNNSTIRLVDPGLLGGTTCSSLPRFPLSRKSFSIDDPYTPYGMNFSNIDPHRLHGVKTRYLSTEIMFLKCAASIDSSLYVDRGLCSDGTNSSSTSPFPLSTHSYAYIGNMKEWYLQDSCCIEGISMLSSPEAYKQLANWFELSWLNVYFTEWPYYCYDSSSNEIECDSAKFNYVDFVIKFLLFRIAILLGLLHALKTTCGTPFVVAFLIYKWRRRHRSAYETVEQFLQSNNNFTPVRYAYSDIKKVTGRFKDKLGEGGFGSVYKAKLRSGNLAAVKMLGKKSQADGQDFISEVSTIGRVRHANIVQLIGYCVEGTKRALVYDFMPNGSLEKYIFSREGYESLSWEKLHEISIGVARGIEYLHRGCEIQILHFDIKPHNILLDNNFCPKISDFGLAKLCPVNDGSIASLTAARGTIGYMAPELFYKNIGRVSYKADIYSFGMLLLEMAGTRKSVRAMVDNSSQIYFPFWVHDAISEGKDEMIACCDIEDESKIVKKMVIVGLWCIQTNPENRPPMSKVLEMLEGDLENLQLPPRPVLYSGETTAHDNTESMSTFVDSESASLVTNEW